MQLSHTLNLVNVHAEGEVGNVIVGGALDVPGETMADKMDYINEVDDSIRRFCLNQPRGKPQMSVNLLQPSTRDDADAGFIILQCDRAHAMSASNCICVVTVLLETGMLPMTEPETVVRLDMPAGLVTAMAQCRDGRCERVALDMVPGFVEALDVKVQVPDVGTITVDVAFGGCYYALVDSGQLDIRICAENAEMLSRTGIQILEAVRQQCSVRHPELPSLDEIVYLMFTDHVDGDAHALRNCTILPPGRIDRSPCGTGSVARLAALRARGQLEVGECFTMRSAIDSSFEAQFVHDTKVGDRAAVQTRVSGRGWLFGTQTIGVDPHDPFPLGYDLGIGA